MYHKFTSDVTRFGPILTPYVLEIDDNYVRYSKRNKNLINKDRISMPIDQISSISVEATLLGTTLTIKGYGESQIIVKRMNIQEAYRAEEIISNKRKEIKNGN